MSEATAKPIEEVWGWLKRQFGNNALVLALILLAAAIIGAKGRDKLEEITDLRVQPVREELGRVKAAQGRYEEDVHEFAKDVRELYRVSPVIRRSDRLERPFPSHDGGEP